MTWTRVYRYGDGSSGYANNRLHSTSLPGPGGGSWAMYTHDANGNMTAMPHLASIAYTHADQMRKADLGGGGTAYYTYDAGGERVLKRIERSGTTIEERIYLGGYEVYRKRDHTGLLFERQTLHVMDGSRRVAIVETVTVDAANPISTGVSRIRYQYTNHLDSAMVECDDTGQVISYEEYHPYGTSAYRSARAGVEVSERRYRYTGKERDEENGLSYHAARYYAPWFGRWTSSDPIGIRGGINLYEYVASNPVKLVDPSGTGPPYSSFAKPSEKAAAETFAKNGGEATYTFADDPLTGVAPARERTTTVEHIPEQGAGATPTSEVQQREPGFWEKVDQSEAMKIERALVTSLANIPNTVVAGLKYIGLGLRGHVAWLPSGTEGGGGQYVPDEIARQALAETEAWRIEAPPGSESLARRYDIVLPLVLGELVPGGKQGPSPGAVLSETKKTVPVVGAQASEGAATKPPVRAAGVAATQQPQMVTPRSLRPTQRPDSKSSVVKLAKDMQKSGFDMTYPLEAVEIDGALYITDGHHRAAAAVRAGVKEVPVKVRLPYTPEEAAEIFKDFARILNDRGF